MIVKSNTKLGGVTYQLEIDEKDEMDTLHKIIVLSNPPTLCDVCKNDDPEKFKFTSNKDKEGNIYVNVKCLKCGARSKLGQYKAGGFFWHDFEKYVPAGKQEKQQTNMEGGVSSEDMPF